MVRLSKTLTENKGSITLLCFQSIFGNHQIIARFFNPLSKIILVSRIRGIQRPLGVTNAESVALIFGNFPIILSIPTHNLSIIAHY